MNAYLDQIYQMVKIEGRQLHRWDLVDELGVGIRYVDRLLQISRDKARENGWTIPELPKSGKAHIVILDADEPAFHQVIDQRLCLEEQMERRHREIKRNAADIAFIVEQLPREHPELSYWETQLLFARTMEEIDERSYRGRD